MSARKNILMADDAYKAGSPRGVRDIRGAFVVSPTVSKRFSSKREALATTLAAAAIDSL
jgi:hypothetical protein